MFLKLVIAMTDSLTEDRLRLMGGQALQVVPQKVAGVRQVLSTLKEPWWATVNFMVPLEKQSAAVVFRCQRLADGTLVDDEGKGVNATQSFEESLALAMIYGGTLVVRTELPLKVQRPNELGQLEWVQQDRLYGFQLANRDWEPVSEAQLRQASAFDAQTGRPLPVVAGRSFAMLRKPKHLR